MKSSNLLIALISAFMSFAATASGTHAGGHSGTEIGKPGVSAKVTRTVNVEMTDAMRFNPASITVRQGETIRLVVKNAGQLKHELVLGTEKELKDHYELMKKNPEMEHADPNMVTVQPGKTGEVIWQFTQARTVNFACLQPGHYDAGMKGLVTVADGKISAKGNAPLALTASSDVVGNVKQVATGSTSDMSQGEVRKVDMEAKKITLKHGEIKNLEMPGMTMVFQVKDPSLLSKVKAGDKVRFKAEKEGGAMVVTEIQVANEHK